MTGMLRIIMNACGFYYFGVCKGTDIQENDKNSYIIILMPDKMDPLPNLNKACSALRNAFGKYSFVAYADGFPVPDRLSAAVAGLGVIGPKGNLISPICGTGFDMCMISTNLELPATGEEAVHCPTDERCRGEGEWCTECAHELLSKDDEEEAV